MKLPNQTRPALSVVLCLFLNVVPVSVAFGAERLTLVEKGRSRMSIVLASGAGESGRRAAADLAEYLEKISGAAPGIMETSSVVPAAAIWVGMQPGVSAAFPGLDLTLRHPEEILIACNGRHLLIAGRDRRFDDQQVEFGTANAVFTFLQQYLGVRWLWPGELGEDLLRRDTISLPVFEYRFHPQFQRRAVFRMAERQPLNDEWARLQRLKLDTLQGPAGGHAFTSWWERFSRTHPEWFALQPDGSRGGGAEAYPTARTVKMCLSNPGVWDQWLADAVVAVEANPELNMLMAGENDGHSSGVCVCESCRAWDHPRGAPWSYGWSGGRSEAYVAMSNRYVTFWNHLARKLRERFPERDDLYVQGLAYGPSTPPPVEVGMELNIIVSFVGKFPTIDETTRRDNKAQLRAWSAIAPNVFYRPNLFYWTGGAWGLPDITLKNVAEDFRFLADNRCRGLFVDTTQEHWATEGPQYYLLGQLSWDPRQDAAAVLDDYYRRGFGPAAEPIRDYWNLLDHARGEITAAEGFGQHARHRFQLLKIMEQVYTADFFNRAESLLRRADASVSGDSEVFRRRIAFVRAGLDFTRLMVENIGLMNTVRESGGRDREAVRRVSANWATLRALAEAAGPVAINFPAVLGKMQGTGYMGNMQDYFGPPAAKFLDPSTAARPAPKKAEPTDID